MADPLSGIWYLLSDHQKYLYHYTSSKALAEGILPSGTLRFSRFAGVNDPREYKAWVFNYRSLSGRSLNDVTAIGEAANKFLKQDVRVGCFVSDPIEALSTKEVEDRGGDVIHAAYERGHSRPRMWSQYADQHSGACLVFLKTELEKAVSRSIPVSVDREIYSGAVEYRNPKVIPRFRSPESLGIDVDECARLGIKNALISHLARHWSELFFLKAEEWKQEREYRWVVRWETADEFFIDIRGALAGIALGEDFPEHRKPVVALYAERHKIGLATFGWKNGFPQPMPTHWRLLSPHPK